MHTMRVKRQASNTGVRCGCGCFSLTHLVPSAAYLCAIGRADGRAVGRADRLRCVVRCREASVGVVEEEEVEEGEE